MDERITIDEFREIAPVKLRWLEEEGFVRDPQLEKATSTMATLIYKGQNVAFEFSLDVRDQCVDAEVIEVAAGTLKRRWEGGYSDEVYNHLVEKEGYRGSPRGVAKTSGGTKLDRAIEGWSSLLKTAGAKLLSDTPESLA